MKKSIPIFEHPELDGRTFLLNGNQTGVLLIHGFTATTIEVRWLAEFLNKKGLTISAPLLPGHGTTPEDLNDKKNTDWIECVEAAYLALSETCSQVIVGGESMGAVLSLYLAEKYPDIKALLLYSPALKITKLKYSKFIKYFIPIIRKNNYDDLMPWQGYSVYPLFAASELSVLQKVVAKNLNKIKQPVLSFQGAYDKTIDKDSSDIIISAVNSSIKEKHIMANSGHVILLDKEFDEVADLTWEFIQGLKIL